MDYNMRYTDQQIRFEEIKPDSHLRVKPCEEIFSEVKTLDLGPISLLWSDEPALAEVVDERGVDELVLKTNTWWRYSSRNTCAFSRNCVRKLNIHRMILHPWKQCIFKGEQSLTLELSIKTWATVCTINIRCCRKCERTWKEEFFQKRNKKITENFIKRAQLVCIQEIGKTPLECRCQCYDPRSISRCQRGSSHPSWKWG